jgi:hypothetical protein
LTARKPPGWRWRASYRRGSIGFDRTGGGTSHEAGDYRFFAGWRRDPFFCDLQGAQNNLQFTGDDFFVDKHVCSIVIGGKYDG